MAISQVTLDTSFKQFVEEARGLRLTDIKCGTALYRKLVKEGPLRRRRAGGGVDQPGFADILDLVRAGRAYVKISVTEGPRHDYSGFIPLAKALIAANPDRILWGTNWPHPNSVTPPGRKPTDLTRLWQVDDGLVFNLLPVWAPDPAIRKKILVDNPARLYGF